jgi:tetratricopeptide (TPR) repeat protein
MEGNNINEVLDRQVAEAQKALKDKDYRKASRIFLDIRDICVEVQKHLEDPALKLHWRGHIHLTEARRNIALYHAEKAEGRSPNTRVERAFGAIREAKLATQCFQDQHGRGQSYQTLFDGYDLLLDLYGTQANLQGTIDTLKQLEEHINDYRKFAPRERITPYLFKLYQTRAMASITEGLQSLFWEMNHLAAQKSFKTGKHSLQNAIKETDDHEKIAAMKTVASTIEGLSNFGEGFILQERGAYREAMQYMKQAETRLKQSDEDFQAFGKWAEASSHFCLAVASELDSKYEVAVKEYGKASQIFSEASDTFPTVTEPLRALGSKVRFYADAAKDRQDAAKARPGWKKSELARAKKIAGLAFFGFWLVGIAAIVIAIKTLALSIGTLMFTYLVLMTIAVAAIAAILIKAKEAFNFLEKVMPFNYKGRGSN